MAGPSKPKRAVANKGYAPNVSDTNTQPTPLARPARTTSGGAPLHFDLDPEYKRDFKTYALINDMSMKELFIAMFDEYKKNHG